MKNILKSLGIVVFCLSISTVHATIDQNIIDQGGTPTTTSNSDINGFCNSAADCAAVDNQVQNNQTTAAAANQANTTNTSTDTNNVLGIESGKLRSGNVDMNTIPTVILSIIKTLLGIAGTVAIFSLIYHAVQMQLNSGITGDSSGVDKAKKGMTGALIGFVIAIAAWFLVTRAVDLLAAVS